MTENPLCMHCARLDQSIEKPDRPFQFLCDYDGEFHWVGKPVTCCRGFEDLAAYMADAKASN